jgi:hypothetical protein
MYGTVICHTGCYIKVLQFPQSLCVAGRQLSVSALQAHNCPQGLSPDVRERLVLILHTSFHLIYLYTYHVNINKSKSRYDRPIQYNYINTFYLCQLKRGLVCLSHRNPNVMNTEPVIIGQISLLHIKVGLIWFYMTSFLNKLNFCHILYVRLRMNSDNSL